MIPILYEFTFDTTAARVKSLINLTSAHCTLSSNPPISTSLTHADPVRASSTRAGVQVPSAACGLHHTLPALPIVSQEKVAEVRGPASAQRFVGGWGVGWV